MKLAEFRVKQLARLLKLEEMLIERYPEKADRIRFLVETLVQKLRFLRTRNLANYINTIYQASKEFPEFRELLPKPEELEVERSGVH